MVDPILVQVIHQWLVLGIVMLNAQISNLSTEKQQEFLDFINLDHAVLNLMYGRLTTKQLK
jgi:hypothetical protein